MGFLYDTFVIIMTTVTILGLAIDGYLSHAMAGLLVVLFAAVRGVIRGLRTGIKPLTYYSIQAVFLLIISGNIIYNGGSFTRILLIILGAFFTGFGWLAKAGLKGDISINHALFAFFALIFLQAFGRQVGSNIVRGSFYVLIPITVIIIVINTYGVSNGEVAATLSGILPLLLLLSGLYIMLYGFTKNLKG